MSEPHPSEIPTELVLGGARVPVISKILIRDLPGGAVVKNLPANAGDMVSSPGLGRSPMLQTN